MTKRLSACIAALALAAVAPGWSAQDSAGQSQTGPVHMTFDGGSYVGNTVRFANMAMHSKDYDIQAATAVADLTPNPGGGSDTVTKIVALGDPAKKTQVTGRFSSAEQARTYFVRGDKAVFVPEPSRPGGGRVDFTGHVAVTLQAPQALDGPAETHLEHATVLVGPKPDYPQVTFGAGQLDFTPLQ